MQRAFGVQLGHHRLGVAFRKWDEALRRLLQQVEPNRRIVSSVPVECHRCDGAVELADTRVLYLIGRLDIDPLSAQKFMTCRFGKVRHFLDLNVSFVVVCMN